MSHQRPTVTPVVRECPGCTRAKDTPITWTFCTWCTDVRLKRS